MTRMFRREHEFAVVTRTENLIPQREGCGSKNENEGIPLHHLGKKKYIVKNNSNIMINMQAKYKYS